MYASVCDLETRTMRGTWAKVGLWRHKKKKSIIKRSWVNLRHYPRQTPCLGDKSWSPEELSIFVKLRKKHTIVSIYLRQ